MFAAEPRVAPAARVYGISSWWAGAGVGLRRRGIASPCTLYARPGKLARDSMGDLVEQHPIHSSTGQESLGEYMNIARGSGMQGRAVVVRCRSGERESAHAQDRQSAPRTSIFTSGLRPMGTASTMTTNTGSSNNQKKPGSVSNTRLPGCSTLFHASLAAPIPLHHFSRLPTSSAANSIRDAQQLHASGTPQRPPSINIASRSHSLCGGLRVDSDRCGHFCKHIVSGTSRPWALRAQVVCLSVVCILLATVSRTGVSV